MDLISIVLLVYAVWCATIGTILLVCVARFIQDAEGLEFDSIAINLLVNMLYAAIVFIWLMTGYSILSCL